MKRGARLAVLFGALLVLVGAWYLAARYSDRQQTQQAAQAHEEQSIDISVGPAEEVTALAWDYFGDAVSLALEDGTWVKADDAACPIDQNAVQPLIQAVASVTASDKIENVTDFDQYGLADPAFTVVAAAADTVNTYSIGGQSPTGAYYVRLNGEDAVYVESGELAVRFQIPLDDVLQMETVPEDISAVVDLTVETDGGIYELRYLDDASSAWYTGADPWFLVDENGDPVRPLDTDRTEELYGLVTGLQFTRCENWNAEDLAAYGLDQPQGTVLVGYLSEEGSLESFTVSFGDYMDGDVYVCLEGSRMVYRVDGKVLDRLMYPDFDELAALEPCALDWDVMQSMTLQLDGESYEVIRSVSTPAEGEEPEDIYTMGERSLDKDAVTAWQQGMDALRAEGRTGAVQGRKTQMALTFEQDNELYPTVTVEFLDYDSANYLCVVNGEDYYLVTHTAADQVMDKALAFLVELPE